MVQLKAWMLNTEQEIGASQPPSLPIGVLIRSLPGHYLNPYGMSWSKLITYDHRCDNCNRCT